MDDVDHVAADGAGADSSRFAIGAGGRGDLASVMEELDRQGPFRRFEIMTGPQGVVVAASNDVPPEFLKQLDACMDPSDE